MKNKIVLVAWGAAGDAIVCTPALKALKHNNPDKKIILYALRKKHLNVFKNNPNIDSLRFLRVYKMWRYPYHLFAYLFKRSLIKYIQLDFQFVDPPFLYQKHNKHIVADIFNLKLEDDKVEVFLSSEEENFAKNRLKPYKNAVILHVYARSSVNHLWEVEKWNELVRRMPFLTFIQLGQIDEPKIEGVIDWRGATTLREAFAIVKFSFSFVGIDSSLAHVTNAFGIPGVVLFGDSSPVFWGHDNNINIYKSVPCSPCYQFLWYNKCPYDHECMKSITVDEVIEALTIQTTKAKYRNLDSKDQGRNVDF